MRSEQRPGNAGVLGRDSDTSAVITPSLLDSECTARERVGFPSRPLQYGAGAHYQKGSQVRITALGDMPEPTLLGRRGHGGRQTDVAHHMLMGREPRHGTEHQHGG